MATWKIWSWNVNGLRAAVQKGFVDVVLQEKPTILGIQETKLQPEQIPTELSALSDYHQIWDYAERKGYSGTALFSLNEPLAMSAGLKEQKFNTEGRVVTADFDNFTVMSIYFPNGQKDNERLQYKLDFYDYLFDLMMDYKSRKRHLIVMGDYNTAHNEIDLANPKQNENTSGFLRIERDWLDKIVAHGFVDTFRHFDQRTEQYSWWSFRTQARTRNVGWRIDYLFVNEELLPYVKSASIRQDIMGSDHCPVCIDLEI